MSTNPLANFLALLRLIRETHPSHAPLTMFQLWAGDANAPTSAVVKIAAYAIEQAEAAETYIRATQLSDEAKQGLIHTTASLKTAFELQNIGSQPVSAFMPALDAGISQFAILISAAGLDREPAPITEIADLVAAVDELLSSLDQVELDDHVRETARRHLAVLKALLQHTDALGVDAAMASYYELVLRLRSADSNASAASKERMAKLWPEIERWAGRLAIIDQMYTQGGHLLGELGRPAQLLVSHIPALPGLAG